MKELFNTLSNVSNFFNEKYFINFAGPAGPEPGPEPLPTIEEVLNQPDAVPKNAKAQSDKNVKKFIGEGDAAFQKALDDILATKHEPEKPKSLADMVREGMANEGKNIERARERDQLKREVAGLEAQKPEKREAIAQKPNNGEEEREIQEWLTQIGHNKPGEAQKPEAPKVAKRPAAERVVNDAEYNLQTALNTMQGDLRVAFGKAFPYQRTDAYGRKTIYDVTPLVEHMINCAGQIMQKRGEKSFNRFVGEIQKGIKNASESNRIKMFTNLNRVLRKYGMQEIERIEL